VLIGFGSLSVDVAKLATTRTQLQNAADAAALAGASALDPATGVIQQATAIARAQTAAVALRLPSVTNVGVRPTFDGTTVTVETHIIDFEDDLYGERLEISFLARIRDEMRFAGPSDLADQIARDRLATNLIHMARIDPEMPRLTLRPLLVESDLRADRFRLICHASFIRFRSSKGQELEGWSSAPSWMREGAPGMSTAASFRKPEASSLQDVVDFLEPRATQIPVDHSPVRPSGTLLDEGDAVWFAGNRT